MSSIDERHLQSLIDLLYDAGFDSRRWPAFLQALSEKYDGKGLFYVFDAARQSTPMVEAYGFEGDALRQYQEHYIGLNPYPAAATMLSADTTFYAHQVVPADVVGRSEFYNGLLKPLGVSLSHLAIKVLHERDRLAIITLSPGLKVFERAPEVAHRHFDLLRPHIRRAVELNRHTAQEQRTSAGLEQVLQSFGAAAFLLDVDGRPLHLNGQAMELMRNERLLGLDAFGTLIATRPQDNGRLAALIGRSGPQRARMLRLTSRQSARSYLAWTVDVPSPRQRKHTPGLLLADALAPAASVLLLVKPIDTRADLAPEMIKETFGLTVAEARLVAALVAGDTLAAFADRSGISAKTARNQLATVFAKTGASRQAELVAMVLRTLAPFIGSTSP